MAGEIHIGVTKTLLLTWCYGPNWNEILPAAKTREEVIGAVKAIPTEIYTGCDCLKGPDGRCLGNQRKG